MHRRAEAIAQDVDHLQGALEAAADIEKAPSVAAGHALHHQAAEGGECHDGVVEEAKRAAHPERFGWEGARRIAYRSDLGCARHPQRSGLGGARQRVENDSM